MHRYQFALKRRRGRFGLYFVIGYPVYRWHESRWFAIAVGEWRPPLSWFKRWLPRA